MDAHEYMAYDINRVCESVIEGWERRGFLSIIKRNDYEIVASSTGGIAPSEIEVYAALNGKIPCIHTLSKYGIYTRYVDGIRDCPRTKVTAECWLKQSIAEVLEWVDRQDNKESNLQQFLTYTKPV
jgi:hypothetical protein